MLSEIDVDLQSSATSAVLGLVRTWPSRDHHRQWPRRQHASSDGFNLEDVAAGKYGHSIHFWDLEARRVTQTIDLGQSGMIPLEIRGLHDPDAETGFVGAALSSTMWRFYKDGDAGAADKVIQAEPRDLETFPVPVPGLITDLVVTMDDRFLYFSNWLHGDLRQYDISDPTHPRLTDSVLLGGLFEEALHPNGTRLNGGPQMLQLSMDGHRLYATNSLFRLGTTVLSRAGLVDGADRHRRGREGCAYSKTPL